MPVPCLISVKECGQNIGPARDASFNKIGAKSSGDLARRSSAVGNSVSSVSIVHPMLRPASLLGVGRGVSTPNHTIRQAARKRSRADLALFRGRDNPEASGERLSARVVKV